MKSFIAACTARCAVALAFSLGALASHAQAPAPVWPGIDWERATPEAMGMDSRAMANMVEFGGNTRMDSIVVTRWGRLVMETYYAPFRPAMLHRINSSTKAVVGALAGIAASQGLLDTNAPVVSFFKDRSIANLDDGKRAVTVQQLLDMTSGIAWNEPLVDAPSPSMGGMERSRDWAQYVLDQPMARAPGTAFDYNSGNSQLASTVIARATGMTTRDFAMKNLLQPIGITDIRWRQDPQGVFTGGWGMYMRTVDMARFGYLYLHRGEWNGQQLVPRAWADKVFDAKVRMFATGGWMYADGWWTLPARGAHLAVGFNRQLIIVLPKLGVVAALNGRSNYPIENVIEHLEKAAVSATPLPDDAQARALLDSKIAQAATGKPLLTPVATPAIAREISGRTYAFPTNEWGWKEATLRLDDKPGFELVLYTSRTSDATQRVTLPLGMDGRFAIGATPEGITATQAAWTDGSTLTVALRVPEETVERLYELKFAGSRVELTLTNSVGKKSTFSGSAR